jgi:hypothetical protein
LLCIGLVKTQGNGEATFGQAWKNVSDKCKHLFVQNSVSVVSDNDADVLAIFFIFYSTKIGFVSEDYFGSVLFFYLNV